MATLINGLPYYELHFNDDGSLNTTTGNGDGGLPAAVSAGGITDLFVFSHGWNNGVPSARNLYEAMFTLLADQLGSNKATSAAVGVIWPSLLFPDDDPRTAPPVPSTGSELAAALAPAFPNQTGNLDSIGHLLDERPQDPVKLTEFQALANGLVTTRPQAEEDTGEESLISAPTAQALGHAASMAPADDSDAQGIGNAFSNLWKGAKEVLRTASYYEMKGRAGVVGQNGLGPLLGRLTGPGGRPRIHLIGHSFGARLVAYSLAGLPGTATGTSSPVKSLTLIQGAFSHFAFSTKLPHAQDRSGALAAVTDRVDGPLLATFTTADRAVGKWYPTASFLARQDAEADDDVSYRWGAMGHDGYQHSPAAQIVPLADAGKPYDFQPGVFYGVDSNAVIATMESQFSGAHSDIRHPEITWAIAAAAKLGG